MHLEDSNTGLLVTITPPDRLAHTREDLHCLVGDNVEYNKNGNNDINLFIYIFI